MTLNDIFHSVIALPATNVLVALLGTLVFLAILILVVLIRNNGRLRDITFPVYDYVVKEAEHEADGIINGAHKKGKQIIDDAQKRARDIRLRAEKDAEEYIEKEKQESAQMNEAHAARLEELAKRNQELTKIYEQKLDAQYINLEEYVKAQQKKSEVAVDKASAVLVERIQESQKELHAQLSKEISGQLEGAFEDVERAIDAYRVKHLRLIDDQIISLVEQTTAIVLRKELPLRDHSEFIYRALEEVKQKGLFS